MRSVQTSLHRLSPAAHGEGASHPPPVQLPAQMFPHSPQFIGSTSVSVQTSAHKLNPELHGDGPPKQPPSWHAPSQ